MKEAKNFSWSSAMRVYAYPRVVVMLFFGFSAGLPFLLVFSTLSAWLRDVGVDRTTIGFFSWAGIMFSVKVFWSPVVDRLSLPVLTSGMGRRRSWLLVAQIGIALSLLAMAFTDPLSDLLLLAQLAVLVAFCSATQDICIDAYRIEAASEKYQAAMAATYIFGYRLALLVAGAGAFYIADYASWAVAYQVMAAAMGVGLVTTLVIKEPKVDDDARTRELENRIVSISQRLGRLPVFLKKALAWFLASVASPFIEFFRRNGWYALLILLFISVFRISDITMGVMANPFYLDMGFGKTEIAHVAKFFGFFMAIAGSFIGGILVFRLGLFYPLVIGAVLVAGTNLLFAWMASQPADIGLLAMVISADNLAGGISNVVFIAYLSNLVNKQYTATQYALFSSLMTLPGKFLGGWSGVVVDASGYEAFFVYAAALGTPAIMLAIYLLWRERLRGRESLPGGAQGQDISVTPSKP